MNRFLYRWHRRIGVISALFVFVLAVTGLLLLLSEPLKLGHVKLENPLVSKIYRTTPQSSPVGYGVGNAQWVVMVDGLVYVGDKNPIPLSPPLIGASRQDDGLISFSNGEETVITLTDGTLVERMVDDSFTAQPQTQLPQAVEQEILARYRGPGVSASRILLDIHTGSFFGKLGPWLMGLASILLIVLSISGIIMWFGIGKRPRKRFFKDG